MLDNLYSCDEIIHSFETTLVSVDEMRRGMQACNIAGSHSKYRLTSAAATLFAGHSEQITSDVRNSVKVIFDKSRYPFTDVERGDDVLAAAIVRRVRDAHASFLRRIRREDGVREIVGASKKEAFAGNHESASSAICQRRFGRFLSKEILALSFSSSVLDPP